MNNSCTTEIMTARHSLSHVLAAAVKKICPEAKLGIGPAIEEGFYYDFLLPEGVSFTPEVVAEVAAEMKGFLKERHAFEYREVSADEARSLFAGEQFKLELIDDLTKEGGAISIYQSGPFMDLCRGPHVADTTKLRSVAWQLDRVAGAYWKGSAQNSMLQRIYALAFAQKDELKDYLHRREEAMRRDHRKLGAELELFTTSELIGKGLPMLLPKGATIRRVIERFVVDEELRRGYQHVYTPHLANKKLYERSGHWQLYKNGMYPPMEVGGEEWVLRPMTCPHHFQIYNDKPRSYRELPMRIAEVASQFRRELSGDLSGLVRIMTFNLADSHIICAPEQLADEFKAVVELIQYVAVCLGIESVMSFRASLRDDGKDKYVDNPEMWQKGESTLMGIMDELGLAYTKSPGDAAFYGPKLDIQMRNVLGKEETVFTVQIDFCMPDRFDMLYTNAAGEKVRPVVIHRSSIGCLERTIAFLIEFYAGALPLWFSPVQARILTITEEQAGFAKEVEQALLAREIRVENDLRGETLGKKLREARIQRIPYLLIIGDKEVEARSVTVRNRDSGEQRVYGVDEFAEKVAGEVRSRGVKLGL